MKQRANLLIAIGVAVFLVGGALVLGALHSNTTSSSARSVINTSVPVLVATQNLPAGATGAAIIQHRFVTLKVVAAGQRHADDLTSYAALSNQTLAANVIAGHAIQASDLKAAAASSISVPQGDQALAVTLASGPAGVAGYVNPGDNVNVYANVTKTSSGGPGLANLPIPCTQLLASNVPVLDVSIHLPDYASAPSATGRVSPPNLTYLLAVSPTQAQAIIFMTTNEALYLTQAQSGQAPLPLGQCVGTTQLLAQP
ncbi:MAG: RcpC/CpaB family pilus assembly protein [Acidimicrobiales bacterium]